jgi:hypothetical protein
MRLLSPRAAYSNATHARRSIASYLATPTYLVLILTTDGQQVFGVSTEPALYALDTETGTASREELPPRTFHQVLAIQGDWRLLYTESEMGSFIEWWQPSTSTIMPVATNLDRICSVCTSYALWIHDQLFINDSGSLFRIDSAGRCAWYAGGNGLARGSRTQGATTTLEAYWQNNSGILRL